MAEQMTEQDVKKLIGGMLRMRLLLEQSDGATDFLKSESGDRMKGAIAANLLARVREHALFLYAQTDRATVGAFLGMASEVIQGQEMSKKTKGD